MPRKNIKRETSRPTDEPTWTTEFLSEADIDRLLDAAKKGRHGVRDSLLLMMIYRHGLRVSEAISLRRADLDFRRGRIWIRRLNNGISVEHPIAGDELLAIKQYLNTRDDGLPYLILSERKQPMTRQSVNYLISTAAQRAKLGPVYPHMLRHSCGFYLANQGYDLRLIQHYLGHRNLNHTVHYTRGAEIRFDGVFGS